MPITSWPLTEAQEGLWYFQALDPRNPILNTGQYLDLRGLLNLSALRQAVAQVISEAEALHLRLAVTPDGPRQWLSAEGIALQERDLTAEPDPEQTALALMRADTDRPLDLAAEPLAAFTLFRLGPERHFLYERIHHLAIDGYGMVLVTNRFGEVYSALTAGTPVAPAFPPLQRAFDEDAAYRNAPRHQGDREWWVNALAGLPEVTGPNPGRAVSGHEFLRHSAWISADTATSLQAFSDKYQQNWPEVLTGIASAYLARWTGGEIVVGLPYMARMGRKIARVPCMAMNVLPQRIRPDEAIPLSDWLATVARDMLQARRHGLYRSEQLRRDLGLIGGARRSHGPLVNVQPFDRPPVFAGLDCALHILGAGAVDDLTLTFRGDPQAGILFEVDANPGLYTAEEIAGHSTRLAAFLTNALRENRLDTVPTATAEEIATARAIGDGTRAEVPKTSLTSLIEAQIRATPVAPALRFGDQTLDYAALDRQSAALAAQLVALGAGPEKIVAVALERSLELPLALLAILRAGAAYLPLDPDHPPERISRILAMAQPVTVITSPDLAHILPANAPRLLVGDFATTGAAPTVPAEASNMAYVIYTSGSTGEPKGVVIEHQAIVNRLLWMREHYGIGPQDRILQKTPATFDVSVWEFFLPLLSGAELVVAPPGAHRDPRALAGLIRDHGITTLHFVPSMLSAFLSAPESDGLRIARTFCSGEELTAEHRERFHRRITGELHNLYGPTEAAVDVSYWPATPGDQSNPLPIGWPVWNTRLEVLDELMRPVPPGLAGSLYLGGIQLARGYLGREDLTEARFIPDPHRRGERLYVTGDLARLRTDGAVVYLGRSDHQVKIRGLRIELGEIEAAIMATGLAREAVVLAREDHAGEKRLVSYIVAAPGYAPGLLALRLAARLPAYMVPGIEIALDALPVTSNGKLDRKALPAPAFKHAGRAAETANEQLLARLYAEVLHLPEAPSAEGDFFALGGDSLSAVRLLQRVAEETGHDPGLGAVFEQPVLEQLAKLLDQRGAGDDGLGPLLLLADGACDQAPLFLIHPAGGLAWGYRGLARMIAPARAVWGIQHPGLDPDVAMPASIVDLAQFYADLIETTAPHGKLHLAGWSVGGIVAQAVAVALLARGREVGLVGLLDAYPADVWRNEPEPDPVMALRALLAIAGYDPEAHLDLDTRAKVVAFLRAGDSALGALPERVLDGVVRSVIDTNRLIRGHETSLYHGVLCHIRADLDHIGKGLVAGLWQPYAERVQTLAVPLLHAQMTSAEASALIAPMLIAQMD